MASADSRRRVWTSQPRVEIRVFAPGDSDETRVPQVEEKLQALLTEARLELAERRLRLGRRWPTNQ
jgi:hypothetical protein